MEALAQFHFLRPWWLLALLPAAALLVLLWRRRSSGANWRRAIAADLLEHLLDRRSEQRQRWPWLLLGAAWLLGSLAMAGPTWEKLPQPVVQQRDGLVIVLDLSLSMYAQDVKPSRLLRARYKVLDALKRRSEGLTGLVAYSGDAHVVAPLTDDTATVANLVPALAPAMMPIYGSDPVAGVDQALTLLRNAGFRRGRILLISDGITEANIDAIAQRINDGDWNLSVLGVGTTQGAPIPLPGGGSDPQQGGFLKQRDGSIVIAPLHRERFETLVERCHGRYSDIQLDDSDLDALLPPVLPGSGAETRTVRREFDQWRERGPWLVLLMLPLAAFAFRRGWLLALLLLPLSQPSHALDWHDLWQRPDQRGAQTLAAGDAAAAAKQFRDPAWRGSAQYRAGDYAAAAQSFQGLDTPDAHYNRGNALAHAGKLEDAIAAYDKALAENPDLTDAKANRDVVKKLLEQQKQRQQQAQNPQNQGQKNNQQQQSGQGQQQNQPGNNQRDQDQQGQNQQQQGGAGNQQQSRQQQGQAQQQPSQDEKARREEARRRAEQTKQQGRDQGQQQEQQAQAQQREPDKNGKETAAGDADQTPQQKRAERATEQWLRQIPDDPSGLLRRKFNYEHQQRERTGATRDRDQPLW